MILTLTATPVNAAPAATAYVPPPVWSQWKGTWSSTAIYAVNDAVYSAFSSWISLKAANIGNAPVVGSAAWQLICPGVDPTALNTATAGATASASAAGTSASNAATSATNAGNSAIAAGNSATAAGTSATNAGASAANAGTSATAAGNSATAASGSAGAAATSASNAAATLAGAGQLSANNAWTGVNYVQNVTYMACGNPANTNAVPNAAAFGLAVQWNVTQGQGEVDFISLYASNPANTGFNFYGKTSSTTMTLVATLVAGGALFPYGVTTVAPAASDSSTRVPTTAWVAAAIAAGATPGSSLGASGYTKFANGLILQWTTLSFNGNTTWTFPVAFPNACVGAFPVATYGSSGVYAQNASAPTKTAAVLNANGGNGVCSGFVFAIGY